MHSANATNNERMPIFFLIIPLLPNRIEDGAAAPFPCSKNLYLIILLYKRELVKRIFSLSPKISPRLRRNRIFLRGVHNSNAFFMSKCFHGEICGGSAMKRMRSFVTGCVKHSEYAHSASPPFFAFSPP